jgi:hypothetical protein
MTNIQFNDIKNPRTTTFMHTNQGLPNENGQDIPHWRQIHKEKLNT